jgi:hypothetical protein
LSGKSIYTLDEATSFAERYGIKLYSIYSGPANLQGFENEVELSNTTANHKGTYFFSKSPSTINSIISSISSQEQQDHNPKSNSIIEDDASLIVSILVIFFGLYLVISWRLKQ